MRGRGRLGLALMLALVTTPTVAAFQRGQAALARHQPRVARVELMNAVADRPKDPRPRIALARVLLSLGDGFGAKAELDRARDVGASTAAVRPWMAEAALLRGDPRRALVEATGGPADDRLAQLRAEGRARGLLGDVLGAEAAFDSALRIGPRDGTLLAAIARFRLGTGNRAAANAAAARAAELAPGNPAILTLRGAFVRDQFGHRAALPWYDRALAVDPGHRDALLARAASYAELGRNRELLADTRAVLAFSPGDPEALLAQAAVAARAGDWDLASGLLGRIAGRLRGDPAALLLRGAVDLQRGNAGRAALSLRPLVEAQPDNGKARRLLARALLSSGDPRGAADVLAPITARRDADSYALALHAQATARLGDMDAASALAARASAPSGGGFALAVTPGGLRTPARGAVLQARDALGSGDAGSAAGVARAFPAYPGDHARLLALGDALALGGDHAGAAGQYRSAANILFTEPVALRLVDALQRAGRSREAAAVLSLFVGQNPQSTPARLAAAGAALLNGEGAQAAVEFARARAIWGTADAAALLNAAWAEWGAGDRNRALIYARLAQGRAPANLATVDALGWMLWRTGRDRPRALLLLAATRTRGF